MLSIIGIGGIFGAICRYWLSLRLRGGRSGLPMGTWTANLSGSFMLGAAAALYTGGLLPETIWRFAGIGFLGAYTTMSTFGYETIRMLEYRNTRLAVIYVGGTLLSGLAAAWLGWMLGAGAEAWLDGPIEGGN